MFCIIYLINFKILIFFFIISFFFFQYNIFSNYKFNKKKSLYIKLTNYMSFYILIYKLKTKKQKILNFMKKSILLNQTITIKNENTLKLNLIKV